MDWTGENHLHFVERFGRQNLLGAAALRRISRHPIHFDD
jgi:hypothetical protein